MKPFLVISLIRRTRWLIVASFALAVLVYWLSYSYSLAYKGGVFEIGTFYSALWIGWRGCYIPPTVPRPAPPWSFGINFIELPLRWMGTTRVDYSFPDCGQDTSAWGYLIIPHWLIVIVMLLLVKVAWSRSKRIAGQGTFPVITSTESEENTSERLKKP